jgi:hypothetical protein
MRKNYSVQKRFSALPWTHNWNSAYGNVTGKHHSIWDLLALTALDEDWFLHDPSVPKQHAVGFDC